MSSSWSYLEEIFTITTTRPQEDEEEEDVDGDGDGVYGQIFDEACVGEDVVEVERCRGHDPRTRERGQVGAVATLVAVVGAFPNLAKKREINAIIFFF